jgi:hypothetical protein
MFHLGDAGHQRLLQLGPLPVLKVGHLQFIYWAAKAAANMKSRQWRAADQTGHVWPSDRPTVDKSDYIQGVVEKGQSAQSVT